MESVVVEDATPTDDEIQQEANTNGSKYNGKHSFYLKYKTAEAAQKGRDKLDFEDDKADLDDFKDLGIATDAGWNSITVDKEAMPSEYIQALNNLTVDEVSEVVAASNGFFYLIFCDETFDVKAASEVNLDDVPSAIYRQIANDAESSKSDRLFAEWLDDRVESSTIVIEPMPEGLPYDVNIAIDEDEG